MDNNQSQTPSNIVELRHLRFEDYLELKEAMIHAYSGMGENAYWHSASIERLTQLFPEGQLCVVVNEKVVAAALAIIVDYAKFGDNHTYEQITGNYKFNTHDPEGTVLYGIDVFVHPEYRNLRLGRRLYDARKELCENLNLKAIVAGGRIPRYNRYSDDLTPFQYIQKVRFKEVYDPVLSFQLSNDFHVRRVLKNYLKGDKESLEYAVLLEWINIYYSEDEHLINTPKSVVRIGLVQWQMRLFKDFEALIESAEFFIDAVSAYQTDFILFPELFNAPLMAEFNHMGEAKAIRELAKFSIPLRDKFLEFAISYNINIII